MGLRNTFSRKRTGAGGRLCVRAYCASQVAHVALLVFVNMACPNAAPAKGANGERRDGKRRACNLRNLRGTFSVQATGTVVTPPPGSGIPAGPFATVGMLPAVTRLTEGLRLKWPFEPCRRDRS
jgi:hypothetical protein